VGCGLASGRTCLANLSALGVARGPRRGVGSSRIAQVVLKPAKPPAHPVVRSVLRHRVALADPRATPAGVRLSVQLAADVPGGMRSGKRSPCGVLGFGGTVSRTVRAPACRTPSRPTLF